MNTKSAFRTISMKTAPLIQVMSNFRNFCEKNMCGLKYEKNGTENTKLFNQED